MAETENGDSIADAAHISNVPQINDAHADDLEEGEVEENEVEEVEEKMEDQTPIDDVSNPIHEQLQPA